MKNIGGADMYLLGLAVFLIGMGFYVIMCGGYLSNFLDLTTLICFVVPLLAVLTATKSFGVFYRGMRAVILSKEEISDEMRGRAASLFRLLSKTTAMSAVIILLVGWTNMLMAVDFTDPYILHIIGINIAMSFIIPIYGLLLIAAVFEPAIFILKKRGALIH